MCHAVDCDWPRGWLLSLSFALSHGCRRRRIRRGRRSPSSLSSVSCRPSACQLGALTSPPSSSRRRSICCLLGWQVSMQLFCNPPYRSGLSEAGPAYHVTTERQRTEQLLLAACSSTPPRWREGRDRGGCSRPCPTGR